MKRKVEKQVTGYRTEDGAGVSLVRVLGNGTTSEFDPILMLDSFDSTDPKAYTAGFPMHPHRGIETISYVYQGGMIHKDSLGSEDAIADGELQWMTAGSGILHEEKIPAAPRLLGVQLWLNLPAVNKMTSPEYHSIKNEEISEFLFDGGLLRLLAGEYQGNKGYQSKYLPLDYYDIHLEPESEITIQTDPSRSVMVFTLRGDAVIDDAVVLEKTAAKLTAGKSVTIRSTEKAAQVLFISSLALKEPVAWSGPIVMNTNDEIRQAFADLEQGTFLREATRYHKA
ncbi:MAG: pirin family protein [Christensenella sp.]|nr:pirin family protein [Christensenella sp.]